jgi:hypothetical protein
VHACQGAWLGHSFKPKDLVSNMTLVHRSATESTLTCREYTKMDVETLDSMIKDIQSNSKHVRLLQILGHQLELLINEGHPDLHSLLTSMKTDALVSEEEYQELKSNFALETVSDLRNEEATD